MKIFTDERCTTYFRLGHPERPERIATTLKKLKSQTALPIAWGAPGPVDEQAILRAHAREHLERLREPRDFDADTPFYEDIDRYARASVGAALAALDAARAGDSVFSLMRPPGHHATRQRAMGFCYLNNPAITALAAVAAGEKRVAVYDFDVHHGNGTEAILLNQPNTAVYSIHQHPCYPGTGTRNVGDNCFNFPLPPQTPRGEYRHVLESALEHLRSFKPSLVIVSAGFDAYLHDPLAQETLEREDFHWLGASLRRLGVPIVSLLEGGYSEDLPDLILAYLTGLEGK
ncbi:MAG TPA: histone deacetylase [Candidatus Paceibacterota bacterium]|jgi:acetoin utilization deacetylase AcuC-like enzyme|nr:histone deacetylase [Candidatus Paceibacterota bacterium]